MNEQARKFIDVFTQRVGSPKPDGFFHLRPGEPQFLSDLEEKIALSYFQQGTKHFIGLYHKHPLITPANLCYDEQTNKLSSRVVDPAKIRSKNCVESYKQLQQATLLVYTDVMQTH